MPISNQISLYKKIDDQLIDSAQFSIGQPRLSYKMGNEIKDIELSDEIQEIIQINEYDSMWSPNENNLIIMQELSVITPSVFFGDEGVTGDNNKIGVAVHIHSKSSGFQKTIDIGIISNQNNPVRLNLHEEFPVATLRGILNLDFFFYLKEVNEVNIFQAKHEGMILSEGNIHSLIIIIDGEGSSFPMSEFEDKQGPLWRLEKNWVEANLDTFDSSNVNLSLNTAHPLFEELKKDFRKVNRALMGDIMIQAMSMIIQQTVIIEGNSLDNEDDVLTGSILAAVKYWVSAYEVDISDMFSIQNSLRGKLDRQFLEGGQND
ncbi:MAG: hypothetical protein PWP69_1906 [Enterococcus sp.]|uniref:hypothetical protein n=1 Tax=Enterococcus sp. TaxID=35783 RepID=UPI00258BA81C|nr:hypothetical protein [Enterococcus sp.]MDK2845114.1 hypothetical protein [Enterococcus sp.]